MIKAVFFDLDDTLYSLAEPHRRGMGEAERYAKEVLGIEEQLLRETIEIVMKDCAERLGLENPTVHNRQIRFQNVLELLGKPIWPHTTILYHKYWDTVIDNMKVTEGAIPLLQALKRAGIYIGIGTDMTSYIQYKKIEKLQIGEYIDTVVTSEEVGADKPLQPIFLRCIQKSGFQADECIFIGDKIEKDIEGALSVGMHAIWCKKHSKNKHLIRNDIKEIDSLEDCMEDGKIMLLELY